MELNRTFDKWLYLYGLVVSACFWIFMNNLWAMSFLFGFATSAFNFRLLTHSTKQVLEMMEGTRQRFVASRTLIRFMIYFVVLLGAAFIDSIEIVGTFVGMLSVKIVMFVYILLKKEGDE